MHSIHPMNLRRKSERPTPSLRCHPMLLRHVTRGNVTLCQIRVKKEIEENTYDGDLFRVYPNIAFESPPDGPNLMLEQNIVRCLDIVGKTDASRYPKLAILDMKHANWLLDKELHHPYFKDRRRWTLSDDDVIFLKHVDIYCVLDSECVSDCVALGVPDKFPFHVVHWPKRGQKGSRIIAAAYNINRLLCDMGLDIVENLGDAERDVPRAFGFTLFEVECRNLVMDNRVRGLVILPGANRREQEANRRYAEERWTTNLACLKECSWDRARSEESKMARWLRRESEAGTISIDRVHELRCLVETFTEFEAYHVTGIEMRT